MTLDEFERRLCAFGLQRFKLIRSSGKWNCHAILEDGTDIVSFGEDSPSKAILTVLERVEKCASK